MASGLHPALRHDGSPFTDAVRIARIGSKTALGVLIRIKSDWMELVTSFGFPSWGDGFRPCYDCNVAPADLGTATGVSIGAQSFRVNADNDYFDACTTCETRIALTVAQHTLLCQPGLLVYDKRDTGSRGRALTRPVPELGLLKDDRLESGEDLHDVGMLESLIPTPARPVRVIFWRPSSETLARHRNPIFDAALGITPRRCINGDTLHCIYLGVILVFCRHVICFFFLTSGIFARFGTSDEVLAVAISRIGHALNVWYRNRRSAFPAETLTEVHDITRKMVGDPSDRKMKTKGAESWGMLLFLNDQLATHIDKLGAGGARLLNAGRSLEHFVVELNKHPINIPLDATVRCLNLLKRHQTLTADLEDCDIPKRHQALHLVLDMPYKGNAKDAANWVDESDNRTLKAACRLTSQLTFESSLLLRMPHLVGEGGGRKRKLDG